MEGNKYEIPFNAKNIDPKLMEALGRAVVMWAHVELAVSQIFIVLTGGNRAAMLVVTENTSMKNITKWIRTLIETKMHEPLDDDVLELMDEVDCLRDERNMFAHGLWQFDIADDAATITTIKLERATILIHTVVTLADIEEFVSETVTVGNKLLEILKRVGAVK